MSWREFRERYNERPEEHFSDPADYFDSRGMTIRTLWGTRVDIIALAEPFRCDGKETERVVTENIDERSVTYGQEVIINVEYLTPEGEVRRAMEGLK